MLQYITPIMPAVVQGLLNAVLAPRHPPAHVVAQAAPTAGGCQAETAQPTPQANQDLRTNPQAVKYIVILAVIAVNVIINFQRIQDTMCPNIALKKDVSAAVQEGLAQHCGAMAAGLNDTRFDISATSLEAVMANCTTEIRNSRLSLESTIERLSSVITAMHSPATAKLEIGPVLDELKRIGNDKTALKDAQQLAKTLNANVMKLHSDITDLNEKLAKERDMTRTMIVYMTVLAASTFNGQFAVTACVAVVWPFASMAARDMDVMSGALMVLVAFVVAILYAAFSKSAAWAALVNRDAAPAVQAETASTTTETSATVVATLPETSSPPPTSFGTKPLPRTFSPFTRRSVISRSGAPGGLLAEESL